MTTQTLTRLPSTLSVGWRRTGHELRLYFREWDAVIFIFIYPILLLGIFGSVFSEDLPMGPTTISFAQYFLPGMIATGLLLSSFQNLAVTIAMERDQGGLKRLRGTPMPPAAYFLGKVGQVLVTSLIQVGLLLLVAAVAFDVPMPQTADRWVTFAWVLVLGTATGAVTGVAFSSLPRTGKSASAIAVPVLLVLQFTSGVFFQFDQLPTWMQNFSAVFPLKWLAQGMRSVFLPDAAEAVEPSGSWEHPMTAIVLAVWLVVSLVVGLRTFRWQRRGDG
jgi:ABC-2 type transport system permease protein